MRKITFILFTLLTSVCLMQFSFAQAKQVNLFDGENTDVIFVSGNPHIEDGVLVLDNNDSIYLATLWVGDLSNDYQMSGKVKITSIAPDAWTGLQICIGKQAVDIFSAIAIYKDVGINLYNRFQEEPYAEAVTDIYEFPEGFSTDEGSEFTFDVIKKENHIVFKLNSTTIFDTEINEKDDFFDAGGQDNVGFLVSRCGAEISDLVIYDNNPIEMTPTPTFEKTSTPAKVQPTEVPTATKIISDEKTDNSKGILLVSIAAAIFVVVCIAGFLIVKSTLKNKKEGN